MSWQINFAQRLGAQPEQQDCGGAWSSADGKHLLAVLADGAGGHRGGRLASQIAIETAKSAWETKPPGDASTFLDEISRAAHDAVTLLAKSEHASRATWLALIVSETEAHWVHSGDSRLYHFSSGKLLSRTLDHSVVQVLVEKGKVDESEISTHPDRSKLLQSLGGSEFFPVEHGSARVIPGDLLLLFTDGAWNHLPDWELLPLTKCTPQQKQAMLDELIDKAIQRGGDRADNASIWCVAVD